MNRIVARIAAAGLLTACWSAHAQTPLGGLRMDSGLYLGAGIGRAEQRNLCESIGGACDSKDLTWNAFAGYQVNRYFAAEVGYSDFGRVTTTGFIGGVASRLEQKTKAVELVAVGRLPLGDHFRLLGKFGFFRYDSKGTATGGVVDSRSDKATELTLGVGGEYDFDGRFAVRVEWQRYYNVGSDVAGADKGDVTAIRAAGRYKF